MAEDLLAARIRAALPGLDLTERKMFGGTCFMSRGNMVVCISKRGLLVRVGKAAHASALARPHSRIMEMGGRVMEGYVFVSAEGFAEDDDLRSRLSMAEQFVATLPPKPAKEGAGKVKRSKG